MDGRILIFVFVAASAAASDAWKAQGVIHTDQSPYAKLHSVPVRAVRLGEGFWSKRMRVNADRSIPTMLELLEEHGVVDNFRRLTGKKSVPRRGPLYTDSDIYKWLEAAAFVLQSGDRPELRATMDRLIEEILTAQEPSGYLNTYYVDERRPLRFKEMTRGHELYCLGHLLQAAIAYWRAAGDRRLLDGGIRFVNYLCDNFGPDREPLLTGHPELEMALVELYRVTRDRRHLELARYLLSGVERERLKLRDHEVKYMFSGIPFTERKQFEGHAVRAMYAACGAADYYAESGEATFRQTLDGLWEDLTRRKLYVTGGVGSREAGEAFGEPYELPNSQAYTESCAAIGSMMWNWRMLALTGDGKYADMIERALYNGINSGMSLSGTLYCYRNPLASLGENFRNPWYDTTCCPPNLQRTFASLPGYFYSTSKDGLYVHLFHSSTLSWKLEDNTALEVRQTTDYPWSGAVEITVSPARPADFTVFLRIPGWTSSARVTAGGETKSVTPGGYLPLRRKWQPGDRILLQLDVKPRLTAANPRVAENAGKVAVERGPLVYCLEQADQKDFSVLDALVVPRAGFREENRPELLDGVIELRHRGAVFARPLDQEPLYRPAQAPAARTKPAGLTFVPYYAWHNRRAGKMVVWMPLS